MKQEQEEDKQKHEQEQNGKQDLKIEGRQQGSDLPTTQGQNKIKPKFTYLLWTTCTKNTRLA